MYAAYNVKKNVKRCVRHIMACEIVGSPLFDRYIEKENPFIIDLRSETDYMKKHIKGAV